MSLGCGLVESVYHTCLRLDADKSALTASVVEYPVVKLLGNAVEIVADDGLSLQVKGIPTSFWLRLPGSVQHFTFSTPMF